VILPIERLRLPFDRERFLDDLMCLYLFQWSWGHSSSGIGTGCPAMPPKIGVCGVFCGGPCISENIQRGVNRGGMVNVPCRIRPLV